MSIINKIKHKKYRILKNPLTREWDEISFENSAEDCIANDGDSMETKVGSIKGITSSTAVTEEGYATDASAFNAFREEVNNSLSELSANFSNAHSALVESLAYSGLGITDDTTFAEMAEIFAELYPAEFVIYKNGTFTDGITGLTSTRFYYSSISRSQTVDLPTVTLNSSNVKIVYHRVWGTEWINTGSSAYLNGLIDFTNFKYMDVTCSLATSGSSNFIVGIINDTPHTGSETLVTPVLQKTLTSGTNTIDISGVSGEKYLGFACNSKAYEDSITITKITLHN